VRLLRAQRHRRGREHGRADARLDCTDMNNFFAIVNVDARGAISTVGPELLSVQSDTLEPDCPTQV